MSKRVLLLGTTGVAKAVVVKKLRKYLCENSEPAPPEFAYIDFEKDFILAPTARPLYEYLDQREDSQRLVWSTAWKELQKRLESDECRTKDVILSMHAVLVRPLYGIRSPVFLNSVITAFRPTHVFTLIDDVYAMWFRTEQRAGAVKRNGTPNSGYTYKGRPSLEQLLSARRAEEFFGDVLARNNAEQSGLRNFLLAVKHPARILSRLIFAGHVKPIYLAFPISGPRENWRATEGKDASGFDEVNSFLRLAAEFERKHRPFVFLCPLTIDEKPVASSLRSPKPGGKYVEFDLSSRWNVRSFYGENEILLCDETELPSRITLKREEVRAAIGCIDADVATRDYRLVRQSRCLVVFNPWFRNHKGECKETKGVRNEIRSACFHSIPVRIYQDPRHDAEDQARKTLTPEAGSLGLPTGSEYITFHATLDDLFKSLLTL